MGGRARGRGKDRETEERGPCNDSERAFDVAISESARPRERKEGGERESVCVRERERGRLRIKKSEIGTITAHREREKYPIDRPRRATPFDSIIVMAAPPPHNPGEGHRDTPHHPEPISGTNPAVKFFCFNFCCYEDLLFCKVLVF